MINKALTIPEASLSSEAAAAASPYSGDSSRKSGSLLVKSPLSVGTTAPICNKRKEDLFICLEKNFFFFKISAQENFYFLIIF